MVARIADMKLGGQNAGGVLQTQDWVSTNQARLASIQAGGLTGKNATQSDF